MHTIKIINSSPEQEAAQLSGCLGMLVIAVVVGGIFNFVHKAWESPIPLHQLTISWVDDEIARDQADNNESGLALDKAPRNRYEITAKISNHSKYELYQLDYTAFLRVCDSDKQAPETCPVVGTRSGTMSPNLKPGMTGLEKETLQFEDAEKYDGIAQLSIAWNKATGVDP